MTTLNMIHDVDCSPEEFWQGFLDADFNRQLYLETLGFTQYNVVEQKEEGDKVKRTVEAKPRLNMPGPVAKLLGNSFGFREIGTIDRAKNTYEWHWVTSVLSDKLSVRGTMRVEPAGEKRSKRIVNITIEAKIFGVGGMVESSAEKDMRAGWEASASFTNRYAAKKRSEA